MKTIDAEKLKSLLVYDPETGAFTWVKTRSRLAKAGSLAGCHCRAGYIRIKVDGRLYAAHRFAWLYVHGEWPAQWIDHINGVRDDNRIANLRGADAFTNAQNQRRAQSSNKSSGLLGSTFHKATGRWNAQIRDRGRNRHLGLYDTAQEAHAVYLEAKREIHEGCTI